MKKFIFACIFVVSLFTSPSLSNAQFSSQALNNVASEIAKRPVTVQCKNVSEDVLLSRAWGYVKIPTNKAKFTVIYDSLCIGALAIDLDVPEVEEYFKVMGVAVLTHEAFHLKKIKDNEDEAVTECRAMRHYDKTLQMLGAEEETINRLMPTLVLQHWLFVFSNFLYYDPHCTYPNRYAKWGIVN